LPKKTLRGLTSVVAGEARVVQLFGRYRGTIRAPGLHWVNPFARRRGVSVRIRNHETAIAKVNDAEGNPIEIAAVVVWQVHDTAQALYAVVEFLLRRALADAGRLPSKAGEMRRPGRPRSRPAE
jgi:regulator of protease activity HflC (stomatin/prohibitin superfamily)